MTCSGKLNIEICKGTTLTKVLRWESSTIVFKPITGITKAAPPVVTATAHGAPDGWRVAITGVLGMTQINDADNPPKNSQYVKAKLLTADTVSLSALDASGHSTYTSGGILRYNQPVDLAGYTARMHIRASVGASATLLELTTVNARIALDNALKTITLTVSATDTAALTWAAGVYDLELVSAGGILGVLIIPAGDREAYYYADEVKNNIGESSTNVTFSALTDGVQWNAIVDPDCSGPSGDRKVTGITGASNQVLCTSPVQWSLNQPYGGPTNGVYYPGVSIGAEVVVRTKPPGTENCSVVQGTQTPAKGATVVFPGSNYSSYQQSCHYFGSGMSKRPLPIPANFSEWFLFIEDGAPLQIMRSLRDAFVPDQYIISPTVNLYAGADSLSTAEDYPVNEASVYMNFIGVP